jgi:tetratricopeptide (TPR) repeat protein
VFLGVGSKTGNLFAGCDKSTSISGNSSIEDQQNYYLDLIAKNPQDKESMLALANLYADPSVNRYPDAITYFNQYLALDPTNVNLVENVKILVREGEIYTNNIGDYQAAITVLTQATTLDPVNAVAFRDLGVASAKAGQNQNAILAYTKYLELAKLPPESPVVESVQKEIAKLAALPAVTPSTTSTVPGTEGTALPVAPVTPTP